MNLTPEQHVAVEAAQGQPVEVVDPHTKRTYVLLASEIFQRIRGFVGGKQLEEAKQGPAAKSGVAEEMTNQTPLRVKVRDLPMPPEVKEEVKNRCRQLGFWRRKYVQQIEEECKLQYHFGGKNVGYVNSEEGIIVVAAGTLESEAFDRQLAALSAVERRQVILDGVDPWNDHVSLILSPITTHES